MASKRVFALLMRLYFAEYFQNICFPSLIPLTAYYVYIRKVLNVDIVIQILFASNVANGGICNTSHFPRH